MALKDGDYSKRYATLQPSCGLRPPVSDCRDKPWAYCADCSVLGDEELWSDSDLEDALPPGQRKWR